MELKNKNNNKPNKSRNNNANAKSTSRKDSYLSSESSNNEPEDKIANIVDVIESGKSNLSKNTPIKDNVNIKNNNKPVFLKDIGIHLEPYSKGFFHKGYLYHTIVIALPSESPSINIPDICKNYIPDALHANLIIDTLYKSMMNQLKDQIPEYDFNKNLNLEYKNKNYKLITEESPITLESSIMQFYKKHNSTFPINKFDHLDPNILSKEHEINNRKKRAIPIVLAAAAVTAIAGGVILSLVNTGQITNIRRETELLKTNQNIIKQNIKILARHNNKITKRVNDITSITIPDIYKRINDISHKMYCNEILAKYSNLELTHWLYSIPSKMHRILSLAYQGIISHELIDKQFITTQLLTRSDMKNSYYEEYPDIIYELGKFIIIRVSHNPFTLAGIIIIPNLSKLPAYQIYSIKAVNFFHSQRNLLYRDHLLLASNEVLSSDGWYPDDEDCIIGIRYTSCLKVSKQLQYSACLSSISSVNISGIWNSCKFVDISLDSLIVKQVLSGILVGSTNYSIHGYSEDIDSHLTGEIISSDQSPMLITGKTYKSIQIEDMFFSLVEYTSYLTEHSIYNLNISQLPEFNTPTPYPDLSTPDMIPNIDSLEYSHYASIFISLLIIMLIILMWYLFKAKIHYNTNNPKPSSSSMDEINKLYEVFINQQKINDTIKVIDGNNNNTIKHTCKNDTE